MTQYVYRGFKLSYHVEPAGESSNLYKADGHAVRPAKRNRTSPQKFHTEHPTKKGAENEIKRLLEEYIDFEWHEFRQMQKEAREAE
jgi:hypothetical protein